MSKGTATDSGWSYQEALITCPKKADLLAKKWARPEKTLDPNRPGTGAEAGTGYHRLLARYHERAKPFVASRFNLKDLPLASQEKAIKAFGRYRGVYPRNTWGRIVEIEQEHNGVIGDIHVSIRPDMVTRIDARSVKRIQLATGVYGLTAGHWIIDWKLYAALDGNGISHAIHGMRSVWYRSIWNHLYPNKRIRGLITFIQDFARGEFKSIVNGPVSSNEAARFTSVLKIIKARQRIREGMTGYYNPAACVTWNNRCGFYGNECAGCE